MKKDQKQARIAILLVVLAGSIWVALKEYATPVAPQVATKTGPAADARRGRAKSSAAIPPTSPPPPFADATAPSTAPAAADESQNPVAAPPVQIKAPPKPAMADAKPLPPYEAGQVGRVALAFVGTDALAEQAWVSAINDPSVTPHERSDLIEDLNQDGFPDPKNVTADDVPLIVNRLDLIESLAGDAMDDTNAAAFAEAHKDLINMLIRLGMQ